MAPEDRERIVGARVLSVAEETYEFDGKRQARAVVFGLTLMLLSVYGLLRATFEQDVSMYPWAAALVLFVYLFLRTLLWTPHRVTLTDSGVVMEARAKLRRIPWTELKSIGPVPWSPYRGALWWRRAHGWPVSTPLNPANHHQMLVDIERRAPSVRISS
jgi:hypothetical protein